MSKALYDDNDLKIMGLAQDSMSPGKNRVEEIKRFARLSGIRRIGIAYCMALKKEADQLVQMLSGEFEVYPIDCKIGKIPSGELLGREAKGISCNPAGQAQFLEQSKTELNISFGLCVGHDMVFNLKTKAPVTTLVVKDREFAHNPVKVFEKKG